MKFSPLLAQIGIELKNPRILMEMGYQDFSRQFLCDGKDCIVSGETAQVQQIETVEPIKPQFKTVEVVIEQASEYDDSYNEYLTDTVCIDQYCEETATLTKLTIVVPAPYEYPTPAISFFELLQNEDQFYRILPNLPSPFVQLLCEFIDNSPARALNNTVGLYGALRSIVDPVAIDCLIRNYHHACYQQPNCFSSCKPPIACPTLSPLPALQDNLAAVALIHAAIDHTAIQRELTDLGDKIWNDCLAQFTPPCSQRGQLIKFLSSNKLMSVFSAHMNLRTMIDVPLNTLSKLDADLFEAYLAALFYQRPTTTIEYIRPHIVQLAQFYMQYRSQLDTHSNVNDVFFLTTGTKFPKRLPPAGPWHRSPQFIQSYIAGCISGVRPRVDRTKKTFSQRCYFSK